MMKRIKRFCKAVFFVGSFLVIFPSAMPAQNQVLGEVKLVGKTKADKTSGVWIDGQYVGYVSELRDENKLLLLPGEHEISVRQSGYSDFTQKVTIEPHKKVIVSVVMLRAPGATLPKVTSQIKLYVSPDRAAVFVDDAFVGNVSEFSGIGHGMLVSAGKHRVKIALPGYQAFETEVSLLARQKITIKTDLVPVSVSQAAPTSKPE
jgi:PEGA domain-containing protein